MIQSNKNNTKKQRKEQPTSIMECLELPLDMYWDGKLEPQSPTSDLSRTNFEEFLLYEDDDCLVNDLLMNHQNVLLIADPAEAAEEIMFELNLHVKNELWLDEKSNQPPPLEEFSPIPSPNPTTFAYRTNVKNTEELLMEFEQIYDAVELTHLTPPQTPPQQHDQAKFDSDCYQIFNNIQQQHFIPQQQATYNQPPPVTAAPVQYEIPQQLNNTANNTFFTNSYQAFGNFSPSPDVSENEMTVDAARDLEVVDELVRSRCKELPDLIDESSSAESCTSSLSPPHSEISYSSGRYSSSVYSNDDDWTPKTKISKQESGTSGAAKREGGRKRRLPGVDKKSRKKEQNKNAATRYRQKKKAQVEVILEVEKDLAVKNDKLQSKYNDVRREVKYLKSLMRDLFKAKGMLVD